MFRCLPPHGLVLRVLGLLLVCTASAIAQAQWVKGEKELYDAGQQLMKAGRAAEAIPLGEQRLELVKKAYGPKAGQVCPALDTLAGYCAEAGNAKRARELFNESMALSLKVNGKGDGWILASLRGLGRLETVEGNYATALPYLERAVKAAELLFGKDDTPTALMVEDLAQALVRKRDYAAALPHLERVLRIREAKLGKENAGVANALLNLSIAQKELGRMNEAETSLNRSVAMHEKVSGPEHPHTAVAINELGQFYLELGDDDRAEACLERALAIKEKVLGPGHPGTVIALNNLAGVKTRQLKYDQAEKLLRRALETAEKTLGPDHRMTADLNGALGAVLSSLGRHEEAVKRLRESIAALELRLGPESAELTTKINNLGLALRALGKLDEAEPVLRHALALDEKAHGLESKDASAAEGNLIWCLHDLHKDEEAKQLAARQMERNCATWAGLLGFGSEQQLESAFRTVKNFGVGETLGDAGLAANGALRFKDSLASSLLENQRRARAAAKGSATSKLATAAEAARAQLRELVQQEAPAKTLAQARTKAEAAEKELARKISSLGQTRDALKVTWKQVADVLPAGTALVEFTSHADYSQKHGPTDKVKAFYSAILIAPAREPQVVRLGEEIEMETQVDIFMKLIRQPPADLRDKVLDAAIEKAAKDLHATLIAPIAAALPPETKTLVLSPDAHLQRLPFAALMDAGGRFLAEQYTLRFVNSGRDLLTAPRALAKTKSAVLLGNADYQTKVPGVQLTSNTRLADIGRMMSFEALPGTAVEIEALNTQFKAAKWKVQMISGADATEAAVAKLQAPTVLHLATHGFFLDPRNVKNRLAGVDDSIFSNSMANSGLVLAGADASVHQWAEGKAPPAATDGILSAAEAASLNLEGTELVTLSACETGLGLSMSGYGVAGLKRALTLAGARHLLTTLWQVNDDETALFMQAFYTRFLAGEDPGAALAATQLAELKRLRETNGTWFAINGAAPFVLTATSRWVK